MKTAVFGTYQNGQVTLDEALPITTKRAKVIVTVVEELGNELIVPTRKLGLLKGQIYTEDGFNDPIDNLKDYM
jgi:hypothetical protein